LVADNGFSLPVHESACVGVVAAAWHASLPNRMGTAGHVFLAIPVSREPRSLRCTGIRNKILILKTIKGKSNMSRGGKRPGAGRKPGKSVAVKVERAGGVTPLEHMLRVLNDQNTPEDRKDRIAAQAAPYVHARLANVTHKGTLGIVNAELLTDDELAAIASGRRPEASPQADDTSKLH
jgi:hypothetical protein